MGKRVALTTWVLASLLLPACSRFAHQTPKSYTTVVADANHDVDKAREDCQRAAQSFDKGNLEKAEAALQDALIADVSYAPAHNNLGRIYFERGQLYLAAWEFEYARRLLPESAEVTNNLGLVYEAAGQMPRAIEHYRMAVAWEPGNPQYAGNLARALLRDGQDSAEVAGLLHNVVFNDTRPEWVTWARDQLNLHATVPAHAASVTPRQPAGAEPLPPPEHVAEPSVSKHVDDLPSGEPANDLPLLDQVEDPPLPAPRNLLE